MKNPVNSTYDHAGHRSITPAPADAAVPRYHTTHAAPTPSLIRREHMRHLHCHACLSVRRSCLPLDPDLALAPLSHHNSGSLAHTHSHDDTNPSDLSLLHAHKIYQSFTATSKEQVPGSSREGSHSHGTSMTRIRPLRLRNPPSRRRLAPTALKSGTSE